MGALLISFGIAESVWVATTGDVGLVFWVLSLVGGGACIIAGAVLAERSRRLSTALTVVGGILGALTTAWTVVVPVLLMVLVVLRLSERRPPAILRPEGRG